MGRNNYFQFKKFKIIQNRAAMKVGTDGVLLGAWLHVANADKILDVGTGTGVIALMLAQRSDALITGIEIEKNASLEAIENVRNSPWLNQVKILNVSFQQFSAEIKNSFDLIVSNPPFFSNSQLSQSYCLALAKHSHMLPVNLLVTGSARLLTEEGRLAVILPATSAKDFIDIAGQSGLRVARITEVRPKTTKKVHRFLMEFGRKEITPEKTTLTIHTDDNSDFTEEYKNLTRDFYLNF
ncbi:MAG: methyltransferase [Prolixibacteraceae bacterium]|nr:methyltransferase [Prolixibacteraceae bacterium]